jgi:citrate synthase
MADTRTATLTVDGKTTSLPMRSPTAGPDVIDITKLYAQAGVFTHDPGFTSTSSCESSITFIDGDKGELLHRGYPIDQLAEKSHFLEVCYLLLYGELPSRRARDLRAHDHPSHDDPRADAQLLPGFRGTRIRWRHGGRRRRDVGLLPRLDRHQRPAPARDRLAPPDRQDADDRRLGLQVLDRPALRVSAQRHRLCRELPAHVLCRAGRGIQGRPDPRRAMDRIFTLHADHEQNASTSTVRLASSSGANPFACIAAGIACLWGPAHGGANQACLEMLREIGTPDRIPEFIARAKDKNDPFRLMGFGHRVYKNFDPRAKVMKESADEVLDLLGIENNPTLQVAKELERIALEDPISREEALPQRRFLLRHHPRRDGLPDLDVHADLRGRAHRRLGQPVEGNDRRSRAQDRPPRQLYTGETMRDYVEIENR